MTVQELIEKLEKMPQGARVAMWGDRGYYAPDEVEVIDDPMAGDFFENVKIS